ncbi:MAG TPA: allantoinase AllB [Acidimicrobiales bacterium]
MTVVRGGSVVTGGAVVDADVVVVDGRIAAVTGPGGADPGAEPVIDAGGLLVMPGMVDAHVHFQEPGREAWEGFDTGSAAAAAGGVTTVVDMPIDCDPPTVTAAAVRAKADAVRRHSRVDVAVWGGLTPRSVGDLEAMAAAGVVGFKAFACPSGWDEFPPVDRQALAAGATVAARRGLPVAVHCELAELGHSVESEVEAVRWAAAVVTGCGARLHVVHASAAAAVDESRRWPRTTVETCPHYLFLEEGERLGPAARCSPPIRDAANRAALWERVTAGVVDWIASDHSPCPPGRREGPHPWAGIDGVGMALPLLLGSTRLDPPAVARLTTAAARHLGLAGKGAITPGFDADLVLVDPATAWTVDPALGLTRHRSSPYGGITVRGRVEMTLVRGSVVYSRAEGPGPAGGGRFVRPGAS